MPSRLLLMIEYDALKPEKGGFPMRSGSISALKKLSRQGVRLAGETRNFDEKVTALLNQEEIVVEQPGDTDPESDANPLESFRISTDKSGNLTLHGVTAETDTPSGKGTGNNEAAYVFSCASWTDMAGYLLGGHRTADLTRKTAETDISVSLNLDGTGKSDIDTGIPFYDHMLDQIARHGYMDISITCRGDLDIDEHHTIEDTAIVLGEAMGQALGDKRGIGRYGFVVAMDDTRSLVAIDLSGRPWCVFEGTFQREKVGEFPTEMTSHFFHSLAMSLRATLHVSVKGENDHHQIEACFKGLARSLRQAVDRNDDYLDILPSSKGLL